MNYNPFFARHLSKYFKKIDYSSETPFFYKNIFWQAYDQASWLSLNIIETSGAKDFFSNRVNARFNKEKIALFFANQIFNEVYNPINLILFGLKYREKRGENQPSLLLLINDSPWTPYLQRYGMEKYTFVYPYISINFLVDILAFFCKFISELVLNTFLFYFKKKTKFSNSGAPLIAVSYLNGIDLNRRNDIFWLHESKIPFENILIYFKCTALPLTKDLERKMSKAGFRYTNLLATRSNSRFFTWLNGKINILPSAYFIDSLLKINFHLFWLFVNLFCKFSKLGSWQLVKIGKVLNKTIHFESFFKENNVKINFSLIFGADSVASSIAMELVKGVDVYAHWSNFPDVFINDISPQDVYFLWGPYYKSLFEKLPILTKNFIYSGYLYDSVFEEGKKKAVRHRQLLKDNGAKFIITFFDERASKEGWISPSTLKGIYLALFSIVLNNPKLGLIIKTKGTLPADYRNSSEIGSILKLALDTGRCLILDDGQFPNEAAQASDLVVGLGIFNTAALEASLCGIPCITFDTGGFEHHPLHGFGKNKIVFTELSELITAIETAATGNLSPILENNTEYLELLRQIDPFRDGQASVRIGNYIKTLLDQFCNGANKNEAIQNTNKMYMNKFGEDKVVTFVPTYNFLSREN